MVVYISAVYFADGFERDKNAAATNKGAARFNLNGRLLSREAQYERA